ncbi:Glutathione S-transferase [Phaffia rhodozyma]|uniref:glutathione transferase n=1 Tax=Phaffia rhodozyma TaxID=264483 RepID=A0A0F7SYI4_PHARH|nr:Glutathione S-transferase [Phaffia rhodozyma]
MASNNLVLHFLNDSRAETIVWLVEELGVDYEIKFYQRSGSLLAPKELKNIHPLGKSPVITHDGNTIAESGAIIAYLLRTFDTSESGPRFSTFKDEKSRIQNDYFEHYAEGSLMPILVNKLVFSKFPQMAPWYVRPVIAGFADQVRASWLDKQLATHLQMIDGELKKSSTGWFCNSEEPTGADFSMFFPLFKLAKGRGGALEAPESIKTWVAKAMDRPANVRAHQRIKDAEEAQAVANPSESSKL